MAQKISVVIPNYNGRQILEKNLPNVIKNCHGCQIIVVDDGSTDDSVNYLKKVKGIELLIQPKNMGFAATVNNGVKNASGKLVLLLNSDVTPINGFLNPLAEHFIKNPKLFAVGIADRSHEDGKIILRGRGGAAFRKGLIQHYPLSITAGQTLWVSGGSGLFDRQKFLDLQGFDTIYAPFYWEDVDLSYRAHKAGFYCLFEPKSEVDHFHQEGAIRSTKSDKYIRSISYKNQFIFFWKNISEPIYIILHLIYLPYYFVIAAIKFDMPFFVGFLKAALQIPTMILNYDRQHPVPKLKDTEILKDFRR